ncbi:MAG TPA: hypothetical protein PK453_09270 [Leptospiraceae bacterium]|nr:hypothetical protein [Leptospiraceae bacterium]HMY66743.1 hypothetical protein [Leptospiraceae bacterium]HNF13847.1 hypothetical protein [Leptospiraceae bacterium]HNF23208.1 hypothetical protein [Leptospiraceae bacterium]HNH08092.1 hypothetical protein [Leptospiraceae bacterium]
MAAQEIYKFKYIIMLVFITVTQNPFSAAELKEKPSKETFKFTESETRKNVLKFHKAGLYISEQCVRRTGKVYVKRECGAWKLIEKLESGDYRKYFTPDKIWPDLSRPKSVSIFLCIRSGGFLTTETNEYGRYSSAETVDFCQYKDDSLLALKSIERNLEKAPPLLPLPKYP